MKPIVSVIMPIFNPNLDYLLEALDSLKNQSLFNWEAILVDDASTNTGHILPIKNLMEVDKRFRFYSLDKNGGIGKTSQFALTKAIGEWIIPLDQDDLLTVDALSILFNAVNSNSDVAFAYSNSDKLNTEAKFQEKFEKPSWSLERLRGNMYVSHAIMFNRELALAIGGFRDEFSGSQDHDLALRLAETNKRVVHVDKVLYHWRISETSTALNPDSKPYARNAGKMAVRQHLERVGLDGEVFDVNDYPGFYWIKRIPKSQKSVSVVIPTRGQSSLVREKDQVLIHNLLSSMKNHPQKTLLEIVVVADVVPDMSYLEKLNELVEVDLRIIEYSKEFNFSEKVNLGIQNSYGEFILLLNDDIEIISDNWLDQMTAIAEQSDVGAVGPLLFFENNLIQHGGHYYAWNGATHKYLKQEMNPGYFGDLIIEHEVSGLTGAYLLFRKSNSELVGHWSEEFPNNFNDVDFSLKLRALGFRLVFTPIVRAYHFESLTRKSKVEAGEVQLLLDRWSHFLNVKREVFGPGGKPPYFGMDKLGWQPIDVYKRLRRIVANIVRNRRPYLKIS